MRWPLRRQILVPMVGIVLATVGVTTLLAMGAATEQVESRVERQLADVQQTLSATNFPLESNVLRQTRGLTGAELVLVDSRGQVRGTSRDDLLPLVADSRTAGLATAPVDLSQASVVVAGPNRYLHTALPIDRRPVGQEASTLHVFYPEAAWREARLQAAWPPLVLGALATALVTVTAGFVAWQVTTPIHHLETQVRRLTTGDFEAIALPSRDDEVRDLAESINQLAERLARYEEETRASERLKTLGTLGGGIAHQIRNAATGCRIALDLHSRDCPLARRGGGGGGTEDESLQVAGRQLTLIESHIQRFLTLGRPAARAHQAVDLGEVVRQAVALVEPTATHLGVSLRTELPGELIRLSGDAEGLVQMLVNLVVNAVEATAGARAAAGGKMTSGSGEVVVRLALAKKSAGDCVQLSVCDEGPGPSEIIARRLFEPFATDKPGGTGLGLVVARQIAADHGGEITWNRSGEHTQFVVEMLLQRDGVA
jgi:signal transduction histidine kinase